MLLAFFINYRKKIKDNYFNKNSIIKLMKIEININLYF